MEENGKKVRTKDIARELGVKDPSVTEMMQKLKEKDLVEYEPYKGVSLTGKGKKLAEELARKESTLAEFLKTLGIEEKTAEADACKIEHVIDSKTIEKLDKFLKFVEEAPEEPTWLKHYRHFIRTGKHPECERREKRVVS